MNTRFWRRAAVCALLLPVFAFAQKRSAGGSSGESSIAPINRQWVGDLGPAFNPVSESAARAFLSSNADKFGLDAGLSGLQLVQSGNTPGGQFFRFQQVYQGVPVYRAEVKLNFGQDGKPIAVNSSYVHGVKLGSSFPTVSAEQAARSFTDRLPASADSADSVEAAGPKLWIIFDKGNAVLAWEVVRHSGGAEWKGFVHAQKGILVDGPRDVNRYAQGLGKVYRVNAVVATRNNSLRDQSDAASAVPDSAYSQVTLSRLVGNGFLDGDFASSSATKKRVSNVSNQFIYDRSFDGFSETMAYYYIDYAQAYIQQLGFTNVNNRRQVFTINSYKQDNSYYSPGNKQISYGTGGVDDAEDAEVIWHEYGHSIQDNQVPGFGGSAESAAMGEGFGDYLAGSVGSQLSGGFQDVCLAEWDATSYSSSNPPCLRRLDGTKHYPEDVAGEVHDDGEIWSATLWQLAAKFGNTAADRLVLQHHFLLAPSATFNQAADALVATAKSLAWSRADVDGVRTILRNRGFTVTQ